MLGGPTSRRNKPVKMHPLAMLSVIFFLLKKTIHLLLKLLTVTTLNSVFPCLNRYMLALQGLEGPGIFQRPLRS